MSSYPSTSNLIGGVAGTGTGPEQSVIDPSTGEEIWRYAADEPETVDRAVSVAYLLLAVVLYALFEIPVVLLLPLMDNLAFSIAPYQVRLKTLGWIEVAKSLLFLLLIALAY